MRSHLALTQVLLLADTDRLETTGPALWAMLDEVVAIFNTGGQVVHPERRFVTPLPVPDLEAVSAENERLVLGSDIVPLLEGPGRFASTLDPAPLAERVMEVLAEHGHEAGSLLVVTDQEITPPPEWRYILWDGGDGWSVVSTAAMDPEYWGLLDEDRTSRIKRRARAACISAVGEMLELERCRNSRCFLLGNVDSVRRLDRMRLIGDEHREFPAAGRVGFVHDEVDPAAREPVVDPTELDAEAWGR